MRIPGFSWCWRAPTAAARRLKQSGWRKWLDEGGFDVVTCRDPGGTALGDRLRSILQDRTNMPLSMRAEMLLYMASRAQLVEEVIAPALAAAKIVISDRYLLSNIVYQGTAGGLLEEEIAMVGLAATAGLLPDLTIVLDITPEQSHARIGAPRDRIEDRPLFYQERVRAGFLAAAEGQDQGDSEPNSPGEAAAVRSVYPAPIVLIDGSADPDSVFKQIQTAVEQALSSRG